MLLLSVVGIGAVVVGCKREGITGVNIKETGKVYFPDADSSSNNGIINALNNYSIDTVNNMISFPVTLYRGGESALSPLSVTVDADNSSIADLVKAGTLPDNTVALDPSDYVLPAMDTLNYTDGVMKGAVTPIIKVQNLSKYSGKYAALGIVAKSADNADVNTSMNKVVLYFPVDSLVGATYFPGATAGVNSVLALGDSYTLDNTTNTINYMINIKRSGIADLATSDVAIKVDNSNIASLIGSNVLPSNTVALAASDYSLNTTVALGNTNEGLQGTIIPKIDIAKLTQYAGQVVALGLTISSSKFTIDPNRNKLVVYFNADDMIALTAPRTNLIADIANWIPVLISNNNSVTGTINTSAANILFKGGTGGYDQTGVYQEVHLYGHRQYSANMLVQGSGTTNVWFEVWLTKKKPVDGQDITTSWDPGAVQLLGLNTWSGCGITPFNGMLASVGCTGNGGTITPSTSGTYYLAIKAGGNNLGTTGITASNFSFQ